MTFAPPHWFQRLLNFYDDWQARRRGRDQLGLRRAMSRHPAGKGRRHD